MSEKLYNSIRNEMHTFSRAPLATGQKNYDQSTARTGHNVYASDVRAQEIPPIASIEERDRLYLENIGNGLEVGGELGRNFVDVIKFIEIGRLKEISSTNGESYLIVDDPSSPTVFYKNWIDPSDKPLSQVTFANGYEIRMFAADSSGKREVSRNYGWTFDPFNGILHFSEEFKPGTPEWTAAGFSGMPWLEGFIYIGSTTRTESDRLAQDIVDTKEAFNDAFSKTIIIKPFIFSSDIMTCIGEPYYKKYTAYNRAPHTAYQTISFVVPGFCFKVAALDDDEEIIVDMRHLNTGDTQIFIDVPWDVHYSRPIVRFAWDSGVDGVGEPSQRTPVIGTYKFIAQSFLYNDGTRIDVRSALDYTLPENAGKIIPPPIAYDYIDPAQPDDWVPPHPGAPTTINLG